MAESNGSLDSVTSSSSLPEDPSLEPLDPPWSAADLFLILFFIYGFWPLLAVQVLHASTFYRAFYGPDITALVFGVEEAAQQEQQKQLVGVWAGAGGAEILLPMQRKLAQVRFGLWTTVLTFPLEILTVLFLLRRHPTFRLDQLGLTLREGRRSLKLALVGWLTLTPLVLGIHLLVVYLSGRWLHSAPQEHPLSLVSHQTLYLVEWILLVVIAVVAAPIREELLFRGILQRWLRAHPGAFPAMVAAAAGIALLYSYKQIVGAGLQSVSSFVAAAAPFLFVVACIPALIALRERPRWAGIVSIALLFAAVHSFAWPSPVGLLVLGLGLGYLMDRTDSLAGPIVLHSLFNAVSCALLFLD